MMALRSCLLALALPAAAAAMEPPAWADSCVLCHSLSEPLAGPTFLRIAERYRGQPGALAHLKQSILEGSSGIWGTARMPANTQLSPAQAEQAARWLLSLPTP